ncbi:nestin [Misgurnus anguillicaudatus]|uniref:nestin n=1 Tax=Misgurnus anguillicaudatus TaxID=75329 RepID=UPI003CCFA04F
MEFLGVRQPFAHFQEEKYQMLELNQRLESYLGRVKLLEEENKLLKEEIYTLKKSAEPPGQRKAQEEALIKTRKMKEEVWREKDRVEMEVENLIEDIQMVNIQRQKEKTAHAEAQKRLADSKKELEEERRAQNWLREKFAQLEKDLVLQMQDHQENMETLQASLNQTKQVLMAPQMIQTTIIPDLGQEYGHRAAQAWKEATSKYQRKVENLEESLNQAKTNMGKLHQEKREKQYQIQQLAKELESMKMKREMLEKHAVQQRDEHSEELQHLQAQVDALEMEKETLGQEIGSLMVDRQNLLQVKMSLGLELATYRALLESEGMRINKPATNKTQSTILLDALSKPTGTHPASKTSSQFSSIVSTSHRSISSSQKLLTNVTPTWTPTRGSPQKKPTSTSVTDKKRVNLLEEKGAPVNNFYPKKDLQDMACTATPPQTMSESVTAEPEDLEVEKESEPKYTEMVESKTNESVLMSVLSTDLTSSLSQTPETESWAGPFTEPAGVSEESKDEDTEVSVEMARISHAPKVAWEENKTMGDDKEDACEMDVRSVSESHLTGYGDAESDNPLTFSHVSKNTNIMVSSIQDEDLMRGDEKDNVSNISEDLSEPMNSETEAAIDSIIEWDRDEDNEEQNSIKVKGPDSEVEEKNEIKVMSSVFEVEEQNETKITSPDFEVEEQNEIKVMSSDFKVEEQNEIKITSPDFEAEKQNEIKVMSSDFEVEEQNEIKITSPDFEVEEQNEIKITSPDFEVEEQNEIKVMSSDFKVEEQTQIKITSPDFEVEEQTSSDFEVEEQNETKITSPDFEVEEQNEIKVMSSDFELEEQNEIKVMSSDFEVEEQNETKITSPDFEVEEQNEIKGMSSDFEFEEQNEIKITSPDFEVEEQNEIKITSPDFEVEEQNEIKVMSSDFEVEEQNEIKITSPDFEAEKQNEIKVMSSDFEVEEQNETKETSSDFKVEEQNEIKVMSSDFEVEEQNEIKITSPDFEVEEQNEIKITSPDFEVEEQNEIKLMSSDLNVEEQTEIKITSPDFEVEEQNEIKVTSPDFEVEEQNETKVTSPDFEVEEQNETKVMSSDFKVEEQNEIEVTSPDFEVEEQNETKVISSDFKVEQQNETKETSPDFKVEKQNEIKVMSSDFKVEEQNEIKVMNPDSDVEEQNEIKLMSTDFEVEEQNEIKMMNPDSEVEEHDKIKIISLDIEAEKLTEIDNEMKDIIVTKENEDPVIKKDIDGGLQTVDSQKNLDHVGSTIEVIEETVAPTEEYRGEEENQEDDDDSQNISVSCTTDPGDCDSYTQENTIADTRPLIRYKSDDETDINVQAAHFRGGEMSDSEDEKERIDGGRCGESVSKRFNTMEDLSEEPDMDVIGEMITEETVQTEEALDNDREPMILQSGFGGHEDLVVEGESVKADLMGNQKVESDDDDDVRDEDHGFKVCEQKEIPQLNEEPLIHHTEQPVQEDDKTVNSNDSQENDLKLVNNQSSFPDAQFPETSQEVQLQDSSEVSLAFSQSATITKQSFQEDVQNISMHTNMDFMETLPLESERNSQADINMPNFDQDEYNSSEDESPNASQSFQCSSLSPKATANEQPLTLGAQLSNDEISEADLVSNNEPEVFSKDFIEKSTEGHKTQIHDLDNQSTATTADITFSMDESSSQHSMKHETENVDSSNRMASVAENIFGVFEKNTTESFSTQESKVINIFQRDIPEEEFPSKKEKESEIHSFFSTNLKEEFWNEGKTEMGATNDPVKTETFTHESIHLNQGMVFGQEWRDLGVVPTANGNSKEELKFFKVQTQDEKLRHKDEESRQAEMIQSDESVDGGDSWSSGDE